MSRSTSGAALCVGLVLLLAACSGEPVGRICDLGAFEPAVGQTIVASPSLDCTTRTCLKVPNDNPQPPEGSRYPEGSNGLCTAECSSDDDCERVTESPCVSGFTCAVAVTVGPFCCKKFCTCKDYLDGASLDRAACDPENPANTCPNIER
jgi:hypothetical protein